MQTAGVQSIAEHMYRVWVLVRQWGPVAGLDPIQQIHAEEWALTHDAAEIRTGDNPTPHKTPQMKKWLTELEHDICPGAIDTERRMRPATQDFCKFCDTAEAILYLRVNGLGRHADDVRRLLEVQLSERLHKSALAPETQAALHATFTDTYHDT